MSFGFTRVTAQPVPEHARQHMVKMRDGVRLATDVYPAEGVEPAPAVLVRLPYDKNSRYVFFDQIAARFTARGYIVVVQDVRGRFRSEGRTLAWTGEVDDGYDTIDWIIHQSWSDGVVGMFGDSYYGFTQWSAVSSQHPALRAIVPRVTSTGIAPGRPLDAGGPGRRPPWLEGTGYFAHFWIDNDTYEFQPDLAFRPLAEAYEQVFEAIGKRSASFDLVVRGKVELDAYNGPHPYDARPVPVLHCVGWFDNLAIAHMRDYAELAARPAWAAVQYLSADATDHENYHLDRAPVREQDDHQLSDAALDDLLHSYTGPALEFFDVFLKGVRPVDSLSRVRWYLGHAGWRTSESWPPPAAVTRMVHLDRPADAIAASPGGRLLSGQPETTGAATWRYAPDDLVPSAVTDTFAFLRTYPDERPTTDRDDVLIFTGAELDQPLDLAGPVDVFLDVESTAPTFDLHVRLLDVAPDGSARMIVRGNAQLDGPGEAEISLGHTGYRVRPGHRLALSVASSDFPNYVPNSGTTEDPWFTVAPKPSLQTLRTGAAAPSRLRLTVLPETGE
jgi:predicted acyl esterase